MIWFYHFTVLNLVSLLRRQSLHFIRAILYLIHIKKLCYLTALLLTHLAHLAIILRISTLIMILLLEI